MKRLLVFNTLCSSSQHFWDSLLLLKTGTMEDFIKYLVMVIAVWRLTHLISSEDGPFDLIIKLRKLAGRSFFGKLMDCFYCVSIWIGLAAAFIEGKGVKEIILLCLWYSGISILLERITNKNFT